MLGSIRRRLTAFAVFALCTGLALALAQDAPTASGDVREIAMTAKKYEYSPSEVRVRQGETVRLVITALDRKHGLKLEAFGVNSELPKGEATAIEFTADQAGTFEFQCSKFCGFGHGRMKGSIVVE